jgi:hypothetical protein
MNRKLFVVLCIALATLALDSASSQSPTPVVVKIGNQTTVVATAEINSDSMHATMKSLRELKAANEQILKKQQATLEALDDLQKEADQMKIFSKRG